MKKTYKIEVDCANCANLMEEATRKVPGVSTAESLPEGGARLRDRAVSKAQTRPVRRIRAFSYGEEIRRKETDGIRTCQRNRKKC